MRRPRISLLASQEADLRSFLASHPQGHERAAVVLFRLVRAPVRGLQNSDRYLAVEVIPFEEAWLTGSSPSHVAFDLKHLREIFRRCADEALTFGFAHIHPGGPAEFSTVDTDNEQTLLAALRNRNGPNSEIVALLWSEGIWKARARAASAPNACIAVRHVLVTGRPLRLYPGAGRSAVDEALAARSAAAFGRAFVDKLQSLRVAVVGAGGTGSPTATLLARAGVGELVIVDGDALEKSNLNRVRGARMRDVGKNKAKVLKRYLDRLGLPVKTIAIAHAIDLNPSAIDALAGCDVIFGCTDDQIGREILNVALYFYAQAYIDVGLGGRVDIDADGQPQLRYHFGRVSTILPEQGECLFCQGILREVWIRHQYALRDNPHLSEAEARERYLEGGGEQAPGVGPFTSAIADLGVATLFDLIQPYRRLPPELRADYFTIDFVRMAFRSREPRHDAQCPYCQQRAFLLAKEEYRLNRPALGTRRADA